MYGHHLCHLLHWGLNNKSKTQSNFVVDALCIVYV
jgi:hypothetical protein